ncbi:reverse transcriptase [Plakobranchus ocellatus]|uniref:Reverse transcriptase n=1 Tax=Plakobranchus ocellatus TaxID=259542 RepID=A0AAV4CIR2_9GAST|nr:reverse transcriptase [Plakobranchus ocellatus]
MKCSLILGKQLNTRFSSSLTQADHLEDCQKFVKRQSRCTHKTGKDSKKCLSYRLIRLTGFVVKTMERIVNSRVKWFLGTENLLTLKQAGFRQFRSTENHATYLAQAVEDALEERKITFVTWIYLEKEFDKVDRGISCPVLQADVLATCTNGSKHTFTIKEKGSVKTRYTERKSYCTIKCIKMKLPPDTIPPLCQRLGDGTSKRREIGLECR